jgi:hypothetical protein
MVAANVVLKPFDASDASTGELSMREALSRIDLTFGLRLQSAARDGRRRRPACFGFEQTAFAVHGMMT